MSKNKQQQAVESTNKISPNLWYLIAFLEGALVIFSELIGAKMLASFYGSSLVVWTAVICVTITFLTIGYYVGGKFSKKENKISILRNCFTFAALFVIIMPFWSETLFLKFNEASLVEDAIKTSLLLIGPSVLCLGISSPIIIQLLSDQLTEVGNVAGKVYAISTLAGILSTLVLGYFLLPTFGLKIPLFISSILLISISLYLKRNIGNILISLIILIMGFNSIFQQKVDVKSYKTLHESEGLMGQLKVMDQNFPASNIQFRILFINGIPQTVIYNMDKKARSFWEYMHKISAVASLKKNKNTLLIGLGGGVIANELQKLNMKLDIVDIDKRMLPLAKNFFHFSPKKSTRIFIDDARHFIKTSTKKYDFIAIDVLSGEVQPSNIFTLEGINELKNLLTKDGIVIIQYQEKFNSAAISGSQSIAKTFLKNQFKVYQNIENIDVASVILACSQSEIPFEKIDTLQLTENVLAQPWLKDFLKQPFTPIKIASKNSVLLVDDQPILEKLNAETIEIWRKSMVKFYGLKLLEKKLEN